MVLTVDVLGALRASADGRPREVTGDRLRALLARLAVAGGGPVAVSTLADAVWAGAAPAEETAALQSLVSRLRRALGGPDTVRQDAGGYRLTVQPGDIDAVRAARLVDQGTQALRDGDAQLAATTLQEARALWRGEPAAELPAGELVRLGQLRSELTATAVEADLLLGRAPGALPELQAAVAAAPLDERYAGLLVRALAATGRPAEALAAYERLRAGLADTLGLDPSPQLRDLHLELLRREQPATAPRLRASWTSFVGRDADLTRVAALLEAGRLVTVIGPGGAGKTRLAVEAAHREVGRTVWLVELAPVTDPGEVPQAVLAALGRREGALLEARAVRPGREATALLVETLAARDALLLLDNCEHQLDAVATLAETLLAGCPDLRLLTTSREPVGLVGEALVPLAPLPVPGADADADAAGQSPAVRLLLDRAAAAQPSFVLDDTNAGAVVEIVRRLDGLPLAIELAAARLRTLPVAEVARRLSDRFRLLTGGSRTAVPRHRTLHAVVAWSWDLLTPAERLLAERLAVLVGGISPAAATAVCGDAGGSPDVSELLTALVDRSLLEQVGGDAPRYRMLETIREFGVERLAARGELAALHDRHATHFAELAARADRRLRTPEQVPALDLLRLEHDNVLAALRRRCDEGRADLALGLTLDLAYYWQLLGRDAEAATWLRAALDVTGGDPGLRAQAEVLLALSSATQPTSRPPDDRERPHLGRLERAVDGLELRPAVALALPVVLFFGGRLERAQHLLDRLAGSPDQWLAAAGRLFRARTAENDGDLARMRTDGESALAAFRELGDAWGIATALPLLALSRQYDGDLDGALAALREAEACSRSLGSLDVRDELFLVLRLVDLLLRLGRSDEAVAGCRTAGGLAARSGSPEMVSITAALTGTVVRLTGDLTGAVALQEAADLTLAALPEGTVGLPGAEHGVAIVEAAGALVDVALGRLDAADARMRRAHPAARAAEDLPVLALVGVALAGLAVARGDHATAAHALGAAARLRGADDPTSPDVRVLSAACRAALGGAAYADAYDRGRALDRTGATAALDPACQRA